MSFRELNLKGFVIFRNIFRTIPPLTRVYHNFELICDSNLFGQSGDSGQASNPRPMVNATYIRNEIRLGSISYS